MASNNGTKKKVFDESVEKDKKKRQDNQDKRSALKTVTNDKGSLLLNMATNGAIKKMPTKSAIKSQENDTKRRSPRLTALNKQKTQEQNKETARALKDIINTHIAERRTNPIWLRAKMENKKVKESLFKKRIFLRLYTIWRKIILMKYSVTYMINSCIKTRQISALYN
ncbi:uncharacterized protein [Temnothorax longispinosus]|uniref:uncharacterized protein n=1 Tax=Temnothorax longispinosus TaxID=300112 RepID=UPI003A9999A7